MINTIFRYLKESYLLTILWVITCLVWIIGIVGIHWNLWFVVIYVTLFFIIVHIGQLEDKIKELQEQLDKYKI
jgi:Flp pilus assembly protein TadB